MFVILLILFVFFCRSFLDETFSSITSDEHVLLSRSHSCELPQTPNSSHATTRSSIASTMSSNSQLSHPSPTPSSASSSSNSLSMHSDGLPGQLVYRPHRPKFGQTSPKQLRKLLALSDGAVIVPHSSGSNNNSHHHSSNTSHQNHYHHHHSHQYSNHNTRASNSSLNSNMSSNTGYYNSLYGSHPHNYPNLLSSNNGGYGNGSVHNSANSYVPASNHSKGPYSSHQMNHQSAPYSNSNCSMPNCCGSSQNGALYPNQSYCSCCTTNSTVIRPTMMMMPPPQTSGLMHPACPCSATSQQPSRRQSSLPPKQPLPVESSSVTSLRRLEQYQQMTRHREISQQTCSNKQSTQSSRRPQCPDYDTTMQRICEGNSLSMNGGVSGSNNGLLNKTSTHHHSQSRSHHREDIV